MHVLFFFNDTATTEIYTSIDTLSLHDALPISRFAAYWWAVFAAFNTVGSVWYLRSGIVDLPRYGATQSTMLMAATLGVVLAAIMRETPGTETDHGPSFLSRHHITAHLIAGTISFAMADALIRMRDRHLVADNVNHYAVLGCAMFAAILAGLIGRHHRIPVERPLRSNAIS